MKKKFLIQELSQFGVTSSYDEFLLFKDSAAYAAMKRGYQDVKSSEENHKLIQGIADNFDCSISSPSGLKQTHSMAVIMTQEHLSAHITPASTFTSSIERKTRKDLKAHVFPQ